MSKKILIPPSQDVANRIVTPDENGDVVIKRNLGVGVPSRFYYRFDGNIASFATMVPWLPSGHPFQIAFDVQMLGATQSMWVVAGASGSDYPGVRITTSNIQFYYQRTEGLIIDQIFPGYEFGTHYRARIHQLADRYESVVNGVIGGVAGTSQILDSLNTIGNRGGGSQALDGYIANLALYDEADPSNNRYYPMDEGTGDKFIDEVGGFSATIDGNFNESNWIKF